MSGRGPTSHDVARVAGVSQSAVSRAFTPGASVSPEMRGKIDAAAAMLGYRPNRLPGIMRKGRSGIVAVVVGGLYNPFHTLTLEAFARALTAAGRKIMFIQVDSDRELDAAVGDLVGLRVDGVLSALSLSSPDLALVLDQHRLPIVALNSPIESEWVRVVSSDNSGAGHTAARTLYTSGSRQFASIMGPQDAPAHALRADGFAAALSGFGVMDVSRLYGGYGYDWGRQAAADLLRSGARPDGVFCGNDLIAAGVIDCWATSADLHAPRDFRIIGFDDVPVASWASYDLTSFDQDVTRLASLAIATLDGIGTAPRSLQPLIVPPNLIRRRSC